MSNWDERYSADTFFYGTEPNDFLRENASRLKKGGRVLCLAEGEGRNAVYLAGLGLEVTAMDGSSVGLAKLERFAASRGVTVRTEHADLAVFDPGVEAWDAIVSIWAHLPTELRRKVHGQCVRALRPGGFFILEAYTPKQLEYKTGGPPTVDLLMTLEAVRTELAGLEFLHALETEREIHEGQGHRGRSAVLQVVARRP